MFGSGAAYSVANFPVTPTPPDICVENVKSLRNGEAERCFDAMMHMLKQIG